MAGKDETQLYEVSGPTFNPPSSALEVLSWAPAWLTGSERLLLFTLIYSLRPERYLEIGTLQGGSALIVSAAMDAFDSPGRIVCVDIKPQVDPAHWQKIEHRASMLTGDSRVVLPKAREVAGGPFDFVFIDASHSEAAVLRDANKVLPILAEGGYLLFHDSYYRGVARATRSFAIQHLGRVVDFGILTREFTSQLRGGTTERYCGFRLMQLRRRSEGRLSRRWDHWKLALIFAAREKLPIPQFVRSARRALQRP